MIRRLVINADDFGQTDATTDGICQAAAAGCLTSTTLLANGGPAAERALRLADDLPGLGVGLHLNLTQGPPTADPDRVADLIGADGRFRHSPGRLLVLSALGQRFRDQVRIEWAAQLAWFRDHGRRPTHIDSHKHVHSAPALFAIATDLARQFETPFIRLVAERVWRPALARPCPPLTRGRRVKQMIAAQVLRLAFARGNRRRLGRLGLRAADHFFGVADTGGWCIPAIRLLMARLPGGLSELMVHPGLEDPTGDPGRLACSRPAELAALLAGDLPARAAALHIELTNFGRLAAE